MLICSGIAIADQKVISSEDDFTAGSFSNMQLNIEPTSSSCIYRYISSGYNYYTSGQQGCDEGYECNAEGQCSVVEWVVCGDNLVVNHIVGDVAPINKTVTYGTVATSIGGTGTKCWITQNLGADQQAISASDTTEASGGWYWQFNRKQGYAVGPIPSWTITYINQDSDWTATNDPCTIELGTGWRLPTSIELSNADATGGWNNYNDTFTSPLKLHAAGYLHTNADGALYSSGRYGRYWCSKQESSGNGRYLFFSNSDSGVGGWYKAYGFNVRCLKD